MAFIVYVGPEKIKYMILGLKFNTHIKTQSHQKWIRALNDNKANFFVELEKSKELVKTQRKIIAELEIQVQVKTVAVDYLTALLSNPVPKIEKFN